MIFQYLIAALVSASAVSSVPQPASARPKIVALGDSLTAGRGVPADKAWPSLVQARLNDDALDFTVVNAGVSGDTSGGAVRRFERVLDSDVRILIVALGANDGLRGVRLATVEDNLSAIITAAQQRGIQVLLCGMETPPLHGWEYTVGFHELFPRLAARYDVPLVPFLLTGVALARDMNLEDGVHPNAAGARVIADNVWPRLEPMLRRLALPR